MLQSKQTIIDNSSKRDEKKKKTKGKKTTTINREKIYVTTSRLFHWDIHSFWWLLSLATDFYVFIRCVCRWFGTNFLQKQSAQKKKTFLPSFRRRRWRQCRYHVYSTVSSTHKRASNSSIFHTHMTNAINMWRKIHPYAFTSNYGK